MAHSELDISTKRIYEPAADGDGQRILVDRLWPRGLKKEAVSIDLWLKEIAPTADLRKWFSHDPERFREFSRRYRAELDANKPVVDQLRALLKHGHITLLYAAHDAEHNHAVVLAEYLRVHLSVSK